MDGSGTADRVDRAAVSPGVSTAGATQTRAVDPLTVTQRLQQEGRWAGQIELERNKMMKLAKTRFPDKSERQAWVYGELDRMYPPLDPPESHPPLAVLEPEAPKPPNPSGGQIQGLSDLPADWPDLPANASLGVEIAWVQANRLRIVEERLGRATVVRLDRALSPAPSWAALGWLETSIRSYAKFVDVASKAASVDDEQAVWKHERVAVEEMEQLLAEMSEGYDSCEPIE